MANTTQEAFEDFTELISLRATERTRIDSAVRALTDHLSEYFNVPKSSIILQGSYASNTTVRPLPGGEYDVDIVVLCAADSDSPEESLQKVEEALKASPAHVDKIGEQKKSCVRLIYASDQDDRGFHVDVVPARETTSGLIEVPRRGAGWKTSNPAAFAAWVVDHGDSFRSLVLLMKRWRDEKQTRQAIKSILLQVLISEAWTGNAKPEDMLGSAFRNLHQSLLDSQDEVPIIPNPVLPEENLAEHWSKKEYQEFREAIASANQLAEAALQATSESDRLANWKSLFGKEFPANEEEKHLSSSNGDSSGAGTTWTTPAKSRPYYAQCD